MTSADEQTSVDEHPSGVDSGDWSRVVDAVLPGVWETALERRLSAADAAVVCDATLLALLEGWDQPTDTIEDRLSLSSLAAAGRRRAAVECERLTRLKERRSAATRIIDLTEQHQPEGLQR